MRSAKKRVKWAVVCVVVSCVAGVYADPGALSSEMIESIQSSFQMDAHTRAMYNAITSTDVTKVALNRDILRAHNDLYTNKIDVKGVTNQKSSGRCWLFAGLNTIRHRVRSREGLKNLEFSQIYLTFWDKFEKSNTFLERMITFRDRDLMDRELVIALKSPCDDGGYWENVVDLVNKYGLVPKEVYPETNSSEATRSMNGILEQLLRANAVKLRKMNAEGASLRQMRQEKTKMLADVYRVLAMNLGEPPSEFVWRYEPGSGKKEDEKSDDAEDDDKSKDKKIKENKQDIAELSMTPREFFQKFAAVDMGDWVNIFNDTTHPYGKRYTIAMSRNIREGRDITYLNVDIDTLKAIAIASITDNTPLMFACNVSVDQSSELGIMAAGLYDYDSVYGIDMAMSKQERALYRHGVRNHGMVLVGVDLDGDRAVKWRVENSWGAERGKGGYWAMYDDWFDLHVYNIIVRKEYVPKKVLDILKQKPIALPAWDPML
ncbi:MAG: C1 family peptidase [Phycisphaerae bacterium]|nr:C1 family peptidase [Phycisphaerae bacterium]